VGSTISLGVFSAKVSLVAMITDDWVMAFYSQDPSCFD